MRLAFIPALVLALALTPSLAQAYIGPGAGVSAIGAAMALLAAVFFAIVGFLWYPVKRLIRAFRRKPADTGTAATPAPSTRPGE